MRLLFKILIVIFALFVIGASLIFTFTWFPPSSPFFNLVISFEYPMVEVTGVIDKELSHTLCNVKYQMKSEKIEGEIEDNSSILFLAGYKIDEGLEGNKVRVSGNIVYDYPEYYKKYFFFGPQCNYSHPVVIVKEIEILK